MSDTTQNLRKEVSLYYKVFGSLAVLTVITVAISNLKVGVAMAVFLALLVATTKASLVASFFMHLSHEKKVIYLVLLLTIFFFVGLMGLVIAGNFSVPEGHRNLNFEYHSDKSATGHDVHEDSQTKSVGGHH